jgi:hypothetical protein
MYLLRGRTPVLGRTAFGDVADVVVVLGKAVAVDEILKELAGPADKRTSLNVLLLARSFADDHERSLTAASVDYDVGAAGSQTAVIAGAALCLEFFPLCIKSICHLKE